MPISKASSNAVAPAAKGDLVVGTTTNDSGILGVGNNGETLVADSSTSTGLRYQPTQAAGKNYVINGGFDIWQRGTSSATNGGYLTADRWNFDSSNCTKSQQSSGAPNGSRYYLRNAFTGASAYATALHFIETANTAYLWGKTVTLSVKLRRNASMSSNLYMTIRKNATVDAGPGTASWSEITAVTVTNANLPTGTTSADWYTASLTATIPNDGTANSISFYVATVTAQGSGAQWEMAQAQLEIGSVATEFSRAGGTLAGELAACQRYLTRFTTSSGTFTYGVGGTYNTSSGYVTINLPVTMRTTPTLGLTGTASNYRAYAYGNGFITCTGIALQQGGLNQAMIDFNTAGGMNTNQAVALTSDTGLNGYLEFRAEL